ncbi:hypothetical protein [Thermococcus waiotapuensis]|uniref:Uncharacterized protein n=1 Tax=Thermococcus waiotapuensis TaxID=90909 RepID=A0AAE4NV43_9EURY|nr:hypothetical protein [Thermococcus waiotapuensis]MDV3103185.1 hypothetical protein [Thermococcus waiotapuensis]
MAGDFVTALVLLRMPGDAEIFDDGIVLRSAEEMPRPYPVWVSSLLKVFAVIAFLLPPKIPKDFFLAFPADCMAMQLLYSAFISLKTLEAKWC